MDGSADRIGTAKPQADYQALPPAVRLDATVASIDPDVLPDPAAGRNVDQHRAVRDD